MNLEPGVYNCPNCESAMKGPGPLELECGKLRGDIAALQFMLNHEWRANNGAEPTPRWVPFARGMQEAAKKSPNAS